MKKKSYISCATIILVIVAVISQIWKKNNLFLTFQQAIPEMPVQKYTDTDVENLALLCKVWGFMKYYHPAVRAGEYDWDRELLCIMPSLLSLPSREKRNEILVKWINRFDYDKKSGNYTLCELDSIKLLPDLDWLEDKETLGIILSSRLKEIRDAERNSTSYYVKLARFGAEDGNAVFEHEDAYFQCIFPNVAYQLLSLFRLWNAIHYYFPYKYLLKKDWNEILLENLPLFLNVVDKADYEKALKRIVGEMHDAHGSISGGNPPRFVVPAMIRFIEGKAVVIENCVLKANNKKAINHILQSGDVIMRINSEEVDSLVKRITPYISASNEASLMRNIAVNELLWSNDTILYVDYERNGIIEKAKIRCFLKDIVQFTTYQKPKPLITILPSDILYLFMGSSIGGEVPQEIKAKGMIIDLRGYPTSDKVKGYWNYDILYPSPTDFAMFTSGSILHPGLFTFGPIVKVGKENKNYYQGKKIILINELTQSHAEFMSMKYRCAPNTLVWGSQTAGADGNCSSIVLPGNFRVTFTGLGVYYPDKSETQQIGIIPDIEIENTIRGIREGRDEVLEAAIKYLNTEEVK